MTTTQEYIDAVIEVLEDILYSTDTYKEISQLVTIGIERVNRMAHLRAVCEGCGKGVDSPAECHKGNEPVTYWCDDCLIPMLEKVESEEGE